MVRVGGPGSVGQADAFVVVERRPFERPAAGADRQRRVAGNAERDYDPPTTGRNGDTSLATESVKPLR